jgi:hypothetical protein
MSVIEGDGLVVGNEISGRIQTRERLSARLYTKCGQGLQFSKLCKLRVKSEWTSERWGGVSLFAAGLNGGGKGIEGWMKFGMEKLLFIYGLPQPFFRLWLDE